MDMSAPVVARHRQRLRGGRGIHSARPESVDEEMPSRSAASFVRSSPSAVILLSFLFFFVSAFPSAAVASAPEPEDTNARSETNAFPNHRGTVSGESVCSAPHSFFADDPAVTRMTYDVGYGPRTFAAYVQPTVSEFYRDGETWGEGETRKVARPDHVGFAVKFINMSNKILLLWWDAGRNGPGSLIATIPAFETAGTASFPNHQFYLTPQNDESTVLQRYVIAPPQSLYFYDPITALSAENVVENSKATQKNLDALSDKEFERYDRHNTNRRFAQQYLNYTGREYLSFYPRKRPSHKMWRADYFGQEYWVATRETHFMEMPEETELGPILGVGGRRALKKQEPRLLSQYRTPGELYLNLTLKVISCAPRAFEIDNFLSPTEVDHIMHLTTGMSLIRSSTSGGLAEGTKGDRKRDETRNTRTSRNTWVNRETSPMIDAIYRRAADLMRIDEALLRYRDPSEYPNLDTRKSIAEALQLVHYDPGQEYTAHHDFGYPDIDNPVQPARFATLLLYLNEGMQGGETQFPRYVNSKDGYGLNVVPKTGKAVLFYSQLPDGNMDDLSHHAALPVKVGEKWLMNLWIWDPVYDS